MDTTEFNPDRRRLFDAVVRLGAATSVALTVEGLFLHQLVEDHTAEISPELAERLRIIDATLAVHGRELVDQGVVIAREVFGIQVSVEEYFTYILDPAVKAVVEGGLNPRDPDFWNQLRDWEDEETDPGRRTEILDSWIGRVLPLTGGV